MCAPHAAEPPGLHHLLACTPAPHPPSMVQLAIAPPPLHAGFIMYPTASGRAREGSRGGAQRVPLIHSLIHSWELCRQALCTDAGPASMQQRKGRAERQAPLSPRHATPAAPISAACSMRADMSQITEMQVLHAVAVPASQGWWALPRPSAPCGHGRPAACWAAGCIIQQLPSAST